MAGVHTVSVTHDHVGIIAASLDDVWIAARRIADVFPGPDGLAGTGDALPPARRPERLIRLYTAGWDNLDADTRATFEACLRRLRERGVEVLGRDDDPDLARLERELDEGVGGRYDVLAHEMRWPFAEYAERHPEKLSETMHNYVRHGAAIPLERHRQLLEARARMCARVNALAPRAGGFLTLASSGPAPEGLSHTGDRTFLNYWSWLGFPAFSLPLLTVRGLPVGVQVMGFGNADDRLAGHAAWILEAVKGD